MITQEDTAEIAKDINTGNIVILCNILGVNKKVLEIVSSISLVGRSAINYVLEEWTSEWRNVETSAKVLSDDLLQAGFYHFAYEIMTGNHNREGFYIYS